MNKKILKRNLICVFVTALAAVIMLTVGVMATTYEVGTEADFTSTISSVQDGDVIALTSDIALTSSLNVSTGTSFTLDLCGYTLTGRVNIKNGTDVTIQNGTMTYYGGQPLNVYASGDSSDPTTVVISSSVSIVNSSYGLCVFPADGTNSGEGINITVNGDIEAGCGIFVNGLIKSCSSSDIITVNSTVTGTDTDGVGIALNGAENLVVGSTAVVSGPTGIEVRAGNLTVKSGATVTATATEFDIEANGNGTTSLGAGIAVVQHTTKLPITVTVEGGTISGVYAIYEYDIQGNNDEADITIVVEGGTLTGSTAAISTETENLTVSSSTDLNGETNLVAEYLGTKYTSLDAAFAAASDSNFGVVITLLADVEYDSNIEVSYSTFKSGLYLDLNGHTLTLGTGCSINVNGGTLGVSDSTGGGMITNAEDSTGATTVRLIKAYSDASTMSTVTISGGSVVATSGVEDVTAAHHAIDVVASNYSASSFGGATVNISGGTVQGVDVAIAVNGQQPENANITINVTGGTVTAPTDTALYLAGYATTTISGGEVSGATGIYMKAGNLYITGGEINGTQSTYVAPAENRNGATSTGDALAIDTIGGSPYYELGTISISGGELYSVDGSAVAIYSTSSSTDKVVSDISITGGTFHGSGTNGAVYVEDGTVDLDSSKTGNQVGFISGGSFGSDVTPYLATGYQVTWSDANEAYIVNATTTIIGPFYMNEYYHGMLINGTLTTFLHTVNDEGYCTTCGGYIGVDAGEIVEETVEIEDPVEGTDTVTEDDGEEESSAIETPVDTETETNPTTGMAIAFLPMAMAALAAVVTKK